MNSTLIKKRERENTDQQMILEEHKEFQDFDTYEFRWRHVQIQIAQGNFVAALCTGH